MFEERKAKKAIEELTPALTALDLELKSIEAIQDPVEKIVKFFSVVSPWHDKETREKSPVQTALDMFEKANRKGQFQAQIEALKILRGHFVNGGRAPYGMNRTEVGQEVTQDNVYLGDVFGRFTHTARDWKNIYNRADNPWAGEDRQVIEGQAAGFVKSHITAMHQVIESLKR